MKILLVGNVPTHPVRAGNSRLIVDQAEQLKAMGHEVYYYYISDRPIKQILHGIDDENLKHMIDYWGDNLFVYNVNFVNKLSQIIKHKTYQKLHLGYAHPDTKYHKVINSEINKLNRIYRFDVCIANYYYLSKLLNQITIPIKALLTHDIYTYRNLVTGRNDINYLTPNMEARVAQRAPNILCVQEEDATFFKKLSPKSEVYTTFTSVEFHETPLTNNHNILILSGNSKFNVDGLNWFIDKIFPRILESWPDAKLLIGGGICKSFNNLKDPTNIELLGFVDSPLEFFKLGDIAINPTLRGTGLKIKTIESICYDKVTMVHPHSSVGLYSKHQIPLFASDNANEWVAFLNNIWSNPEGIKDIRKLNREYIEGMRTYIHNEYVRLLNSKN